MIQIAIMGLGTVGTGVAKVVEQNRESIARKLGEELTVKTILVRHFKDGPYRRLMVDDFALIEKDPDIRVVVETIGGTGAAYEYTKRALAAGKHVVTANKQLVAEKGCELMALARANKVSYLFEASVGGGIPILHPLTQCLAGNRINEIYGILNGTCNYILTSMVSAGATFADALSAAQEKGYAEADPTADVAGIDAGRKTCILADLAFGRNVDPEKVPMEGIENLSLRDVEIARKAGFRVKLLGRTVRLPEGCTAYVAPHLLPESHPMANVEDVFNAVLVKASSTGDLMFYGKGAGEMPTASACVSDVVEALQAPYDRPEINWTAEGDGPADPLELVSRCYFRIAGTSADAEAAFGKDAQVLVSEEGETALITAPVQAKEALRKAEAVKVLAFMRVLE